MLSNKCQRNSSLLPKISRSYCGVHAGICECLLASLVMVTRIRYAITTSSSGASWQWLSRSNGSSWFKFVRNLPLQQSTSHFHSMALALNLFFRYIKPLKRSLTPLVVGIFSISANLARNESGYCAVSLRRYNIILSLQFHIYSRK